MSKSMTHIKSLRRQTVAFKELFFASASLGGSDKERHGLVDTGGDNPAWGSAEVAKMWDEEYAPLAESPAIEMAAVIYRKRASAADRLTRAVKALKLPTGKPRAFACSAPMVGFVYVYPNLPPFGGYSTIHDLQNLTIFTSGFDDPLGTVLKNIEGGKKNGRGAVADNGRQLKYVRKRTRMSVSQYLSRWYGLKTNTPANKIRDWAEGIEEEMKPATLLFCETPKDIIQFFEGGAGSTCMTYSSEYAEKWDAKRVKKEGTHPGEFYLHNPQTAAVMVRRRGAVVARCVIYRPRSDKPWTGYRTMYAQSDASRSLLRSLLHELGCDKEIAQQKQLESYRIAGVWSKKHKDYMFAVPYTDIFIKNSASLTFDIAAKEFVVWPNKDAPTNAFTIHFADWPGVLLAKNIIRRVSCCCCGTGAPIIAGPNNLWFCKNSCVVLMGYVQAYTAAGVQQLYTPEECVRDPFNAPVYYTNAHAAKKLKIIGSGEPLPALVRLGVPLDQLMYSTQNSYTATYYGTRVGIHKGMYNALLKNRVPGWHMDSSCVITEKEEENEQSETIDW